MQSTEVTLLVSIHVKPGRGQQQIDLFKRLAPLVRAEAGCLLYELYRVDGDSERFELLERWASTEALSAHDSAPHMVVADGEAPEFRAEPATVTRLNIVT